MRPIDLELETKDGDVVYFWNDAPEINKSCEYGKYHVDKAWTDGVGTVILTEVGIVFLAIVLIFAYLNFVEHLAGKVASRVKGER